MAKFVFKEPTRKKEEKKPPLTQFLSPSAGGTAAPLGGQYVPRITQPKKFIFKKPSASTISNAITGLATQGPIGLVSALGKGETGRELTKGFAQGVARSYGASGAAIAGLPTQIKQTIRGEEAPIAEFKPRGKFQETVFGTDQPFSLSSEAEESTFGLVPKGSSAAPFVGAALSIGDLYSGGAGKKFAKGVGKLVDVLNSREGSLIMETGRKFDSKPVFTVTADDLIGQDLAGVKYSDEARVDKYLKDIKAGKKLEPIRVQVTDEGNILVEDGKHRLEAIRRAGEDLIDVVEEPIVRNTAKFTPPGKKTTLPKKATGPASKERKFITGVKSMQPENTKLAGQYIPRSTSKLAEQARELIKTNPSRAEKIAFEQNDDFAVATASELLNKLTDDAAAAAKAGDTVLRDTLYDRSAELANDMAARLTEQGRAIQAASLLARMTPEGQVRFAAKTIRDYNRANPNKPIKELTGQQVDTIINEVKQIEQITDPVEKARRFKEVQDGIKSLVPTPLVDKISQVWKAGLLTGLRTQGLNILANTSHFATEVLKDVPAAVVDSAAALFTGKRYKTATLRGAFEGIKEGSIKGARYFATGFDERNIGAKLDYKQVNFGTGPVAKIFQTYTDTVFRTLGTQDQPFYYAAASRSLMDQALAQGKNQGLKGKELVDFANDLVKSPTEEMIQLSVYDAQTAVFQNKTGLGNAAKYIQRWRLGGIPIGQFIVPFAQTPSAVAMQILSYTPVGAVAEIGKQISRGNFNQRAFSEAVGRTSIGLVPLWVGYKLAEKGMVSLDYPLGDERQVELDKAEGVAYNSVKVDGKWRNPIVLGPSGNLVLLGAHLQNALNKAGSPSQAMSDAFFGTLSSFSEQTFLTGFSSFAEAINDPKSAGLKYLQNLTASFVPTISSDVARAIDPNERRYTADTPVGGAMERAQARIPFARQQLEPQVTITGDERPRKGNVLETLLDPTRPSKDTSTPVTRELGRLMNAGYRVSPTQLGDKNGYKVLSPEQNTKLWKLTGQIVEDKLAALFLNEGYRQASDEERAKVVEDVVDEVRNISRAAIVLDVVEGMEGDELRQKLSELKAGKLLTRDVFREFERFYSNQ